jgi:hypothetical protein
VSTTPVANLPLVSTTPAENLLPVSTTPAANFATSSPCVVDTGGKFATGVNNTSGKFAASVNAGICFLYYPKWPNKIIQIFLIEDVFHLPLVSLTPVANLELWISPQIFEKIWNGLNEIFWDGGENDSWKEPEEKNLLTLSL